ncbi:TetR/AcrR family transcriptional regulator [Dactylosporangium sp. CS-047395]|uniref:TetR/AcrR family transcriptional regulator n=1 Tax=Dactylosporangium sp. CS-047395 TaxID=3239936 RepID=UPI003D91C11E
MSSSTTVPELTGTQAAILAAYAELIEEVGSDDVSYRLVARRAGIAERTVFRNYPTRVDLLLATAVWIEATVFVREESHSIFDIPLAIRDAMQRYDERPELAHVVAETAMRGVNGAAPSHGREHLERLLDVEVPSLDPAQRRAVIAALSHLDSAATWVTFRREFGMDRRDIADTAAWAAEAVLDSIRDRVVP